MEWIFKLFLIILPMLSIITFVIIKIISRLLDAIFRVIDLIKNGEGERKGMYFNSKTGKLE